MTDAILYDYAEFIRRKKHSTGNYGFDPVWMPGSAFDFQESIIVKAIRKGRIGMFADTGLGKTLMQIVIAENIIRKTNKRVLILTPLAVAFQFIDEAHRIGVDDIAHSKDGTLSKMITVCNYERLHLLNADDFVCVMLDECFARGTKIDVVIDGIKTTKHIEDIRKGDMIVNASGVDVVADIHRREVKYAVRIKVKDSSFISSPNHPIFTQRGWVGAQDLRPGDYALDSGEAMRLVREGVFSKVPGAESPTVLRDILLSEMANESTRTSCKSSYEGDSGQAWPKSVGVVEVRRPSGECGDRTDTRIEPDDESRNAGQSEPHIESDEAQTFRAWRKRPWDDGASEILDGNIASTMESGVSLITGEANGRLSNLLQTRLSESRSKNMHRSGWSLPSQQETTGSEKGCEAGIFRVEGIEILEQGHPELEILRDKDGSLYFYDIGATRHPSFSVNGLLVHNSSILKNFAGKIRDQIVAFIKKVPYRFLSTATPSPNDFIELGNSSEALGYMGYMDMLTKFFKSNQGSADSNNRNIGEKFYLKPHAERDFFAWVNQWSVMIKKPSDLGFDDKGYELPSLHVKKHIVHNCKTWCIDDQASLFAMPAKSITEVREEQKITVKERCEQAIGLASGKTSVYWCNLNDESALLASMDKDAVEIIGGMSIDRKEEILVAFARGQVKRLITKAKMTSMGLNWQHCAHTVFFPTWSYESYYQAIRRFWRFGQKREVTCDIVISEGQERVLTALDEKTQKAISLYENLVAATNQDFTHVTREFQNIGNLPSFLQL